MDIKNYSTKIFANSDNMNSFFSDIRKYKVLTPEQEAEAFKQYAEGNTSARDRIINSNQRFVYSLAKRYAKDEDEVLDYVNEGNIGLITAFDEFDASKGYKFITFAVWYIQRSMNYYMTVTNNIVKRSNSMKIGKKVEHIKEKAMAEKGEVPSDEEVAKLLNEIYGVKIKDMSDITDINIESINAEVADEYAMEETTDFNNATASVNTFENDVENEALKERVDNILSKIPEKFTKVIKLLFGIGYEREYSINEVADMMGMYKDDIIKIQKNTLKYLQETNRHRYAV